MTDIQWVGKPLLIQMVKPERDKDDAEVFLLAFLIEVFARPAIFMFGLSYAHGLFPMVPAAGYWQCFWIGAAIAWFMAMVKPRKTWYEN